jgi:gliding motility-associated-like protein
MGPLGFNGAGSTVNIPDATLNMAGDYTVTATDGNGCKEYAPASVSVNPTPPLTVTANAPICSGETLSLTAQSNNVVLYYWYGPLNWWSTQQNPPIKDLDPSASGIYTVHVHDALGCTSTATMDVLVRNSPTVNIASDKLKGCVPLCVNLTPVNSSELAGLVWEFGDGNVAAGMSASSCYNNAGNYFIKTTATDKYGCKNIANLTIEAYAIPVADFNFAPSKPLTNEMIDFRDASHEANITKWSWYFSDQSNKIVTGTEVSRAFENAGNYQAVLIVVSEHGCKDTVVKQVMVGEDFGLYVPDAFTPNGDGVNDVFAPKGHGIAKYELNIFDRWGERLFTSTDMELGWDGTFPKRAVEDLKQDVYVWKVKLTTVQGKTEEFAGKVTLYK